MKRIFYTTVIVVLLLRITESSAQPCDPTTPVFTVNLTGNPDSSWYSPSIRRDGYCCSASGSDVCIEFILTLDSLASGISFNIASGAVPPGALYYQVNCGVPIPVGQQICLSGAGPHLLTFCKPGNNQNSFSITSIPEANLSIDVSNLSSPSCNGIIAIAGLDEASIICTAIPPNSTYDSYLSCGVGCDTISVTPSGNFPSFVDYQVCGNPIGGCASGIICDTVRVYFSTDVSVTITPPTSTLCNGANTITLMANPSGGTSRYHYQWSNGQTTQSITAGAGTHTVTLTDSALCSGASDAVTITVLPPMVANAGSDIIVCSNQPVVNLNGSIQTATGGMWSGGGGSFNPENTVLNATYSPTPQEITAGFVVLILETTGNQGCPADYDTVRITFAPTPAPSITGTVMLCANSSTNYSVPVFTGNTYYWSAIGGTINGASNSNSANVTWSNSSSGLITITQTNSYGCSATQSLNISMVALPNPVITGNNILCQYSTETYSINPASGSTYEWIVNGGTINGTSNSSSVSVTWNSNGTGSIHVVETNSFGCQQNFIMPVTIKERPAPVITGNNTGCVNNSYSYSTSLSSNTNYMWNVTGGAVVSYNGINSVNVLWNANGTNSVTLTAVNTLTGCDSTVTFSVEVADIFPPVVQAASMNGCPPLTVNFTGNTPAPGQTYAWSFGDALYSSSSNPTHIYSGSGTFNLTLVTQNNTGCTDTVTATVNVYNVPSASFTHNYEGEDYHVGEDTLLLTNTSVGASQYLWTFGTIDTSNVFEPPYTYHTSGDYILKLFAFSSQGCVDSALSLVRVRVREHIYVPNAFSPNEDKINDYFSVEAENIASLNVRIFNRWGRVFFTSDDKDFKWDGTYKGDQVQLGVYIYVITAKGYNGSDHKITGTLSLIR